MTRKRPDGFEYYDNDGKVTITGWKQLGHFEEYRYTFKKEAFGVVVNGMTDDCWIDYYTGEAFMKDNKIIRFDEVTIINNKTKEVI